MTTPHVPITDLVEQLCKRFLVEPRNVYRIEITPHEAVVDHYRLNDEGEKFVVDANGVPVKGKYAGEVEESCEPAMERLVVAVKT